MMGGWQTDGRLGLDAPGCSIAQALGLFDGQLGMLAALPQRWGCVPSAAPSRKASVSLSPLAANDESPKLEVTVNGRLESGRSRLQHRLSHSLEVTAGTYACLICLLGPHPGSLTCPAVRNLEGTQEHWDGHVEPGFFV